MISSKILIAESIHICRNMIEQNISLKQFNTFGINVIARYFSKFETIEELRELLANPFITKRNQLILGGGSNILFTKNYDGIVFKNELKGIELVSEDENHYYVKAAAGEMWHPFVMSCITAGYAGIENLALIPGCIGASPMQNIGAYGVEIKDVFQELQAFHLNTGESKTFDLAECSFGYRESYFKRQGKGQWIITSVTYKLNKRPVLITNYGAIESELDKMNLDRITIKDVANAVINIRSSKLPDPKVLGNAGSFFKNPIIGIDLYNEIKGRYPNSPGYPVSEIEVKLPAGWLIETLGWKGRVVGDCGIHKNQALVLVNYGNAGGKEIYDLSTDIINSINKEFGILLEREVNVL